ncbi:MAG: hypothetical protein PWP65_1369 [Clostridia bacterium]|nr:hypothetical protein [Clostridia bacterium]
MERRDFMKMRRKVLAEDRLLGERRRTQALAKALAVAKWLKEKCDIEQVYLYGSLAWKGFAATDEAGD